MRVASSTRDPLEARLAVERAFAAMDLHPASLPRTAILCVRSLKDCSGGLSLRADSDFGALNRWRLAAVAALDKVARTAFRPFRELAPSNAEAVLFADTSELFACLALDWCGGGFPEHWWWRSLFANRPSLSWKAVWIEQPEFIPAAVELVAEQRKLDLLARDVAPVEARQLVAALVQRFGLREIALVLSRTDEKSVTIAPEPAQAIPPRREQHVFAAGITSAQISATVAPVQAPWARWVFDTELRPDFHVAEQCWLGIALVVQRAPRWARSMEFAQAIHRWISARSRSVEAQAPPLRGVGQPAPAGPGEEPAAFQRASDAPLHEPDAEGHAPARSTCPSETKFATREFRSVASPFALEAPRAEAIERTVHSNVPISRIDSGPLTPAVAPGEAPPSSSSTPQDELMAETHASPPSIEPFPYLPQPRKREIETNFGGVFYLLNAALQLGLYGDFSRPMQPGLALPVWDFLALVGRELAGPGFAGDPLWRLLAELAGRGEDEVPGALFDPPDRWVLPADWLTAFPETSVWRWAVDGDRMRIVHSEGFIIVDLPAGPQPLDSQLSNATEAYESLTFELRQDPLNPASQPDRLRAFCAEDRALDRWLAWLCGYLRARLPRALGFPAGSTAALTLLLQQSARVETTATHVRAFFSLAQHPLEIRIAGLDRDPGWVPAAGRNFAFYYE